MSLLIWVFSNPLGATSRYIKMSEVFPCTHCHQLKQTVTESEVKFVKHSQIHHSQNKRFPQLCPILNNLSKRSGEGRGCLQGTSGILPHGGANCRPRRERSYQKFLYFSLDRLHFSQPTYFIFQSLYKSLFSDSSCKDYRYQHEAHLPSPHVQMSLKIQCCQVVTGVPES